MATVLGGAADISVYQNGRKGKLKEICKASGGPWGGQNVDEGYLSMLKEVFGSKVVDELRSKQILSYFEMLTEFERKKVNVSLEDKLVVTISLTLVELSEQYYKVGISEKIKKNTKYKDKLELKGGNKLRVDPSVVEDWFRRPVDNLIRHMEKLFRKTKMQDVTTILLLGGFGEIRYVQDRLRDKFGNKTLIVPRQGRLAVMQGAVRFGHNPLLTEARIARVSYGIKARATDEKAEGNVTKVFESFVQEGQELNNGHTVTKTFAYEADAKFGRVQVYRSTEMSDASEGETQYHMDSVPVYLGKPVKKKWKLIVVTFIFGGTELMVRIVVKGTREEFSGTINSLE